MTLADQITALLRTAGVTKTNPHNLAVRIINDVLAHYCDNQTDPAPAPPPPFTWRRPPWDDCPDGCVVGQEWRRQAEHARALIDAWVVASLSWGPGEPMPDALVAAEHALLAAATKEDDRD